MVLVEPPDQVVCLHQVNGILKSIARKLEMQLDPGSLRTSVSHYAFGIIMQLATRPDDSAQMLLSCQPSLITIVGMKFIL